MLNLLNLDLKKKNSLKIEEKKSPKHFPSPVREWNNSIYVYNKNALNLVPSTTLSATKLIKSFFNLYNLRVERKMRTKRLLLRLRRLSQNKIFVSNGEFKHTNNKVIITLYIFNRQKNSYLNRMRKLRLFSFYSAEQKRNIAITILTQAKLKILYFLKKAKLNEFKLVKLIEQNELKNSTFILENNDTTIPSYTYIHKYISDFYRKYAKKSFIYIKTLFFYKQLYVHK